jgi:hypothetical protein
MQADKQTLFLFFQSPEWKHLRGLIQEQAFLHQKACLCKCPASEATDLARAQGAQKALLWVASELPKLGLEKAEG